jgi:hypothetical protein
MTMHLEGPWMTTTKYSKKPHKKWASSAAKQKAAREAQEWQELQRSWNQLAPRFSVRSEPARDMPRGAFQPLQSGPKYPPGREPAAIPSRPDTPGAVASRPADKVYTGTAMKGIGVLHKSNSVPIFTDDEAVDIAHMRR